MDLSAYRGSVYQEIINNRNLRLTLASSSPLSFAEIYMPNLFIYEIGLMQELMNDFVMLRGIYIKELVAPAMSYRTTIIAMLYPIMSYLFHSKSSVIICKSKEDTKSVKNFLNYNFLSNLALRADFKKKLEDYKTYIRVLSLEDALIANLPPVYDICIYDTLDRINTKNPSIIGTIGLLGKKENIIISLNAVSKPAKALIRCFKPKNSEEMERLCKILILPSVVGDLALWPSRMPNGIVKAIENDPVVLSKYTPLTEEAQDNLTMLLRKMDEWASQLGLGDTTKTSGSEIL